MALVREPQHVIMKGAFKLFSTTYLVSRREWWRLKQPIKDDLHLRRVDLISIPGFSLMGWTVRLLGMDSTCKVFSVTRRSRSDVSQ